MLNTVLWLSIVGLDVGCAIAELAILRPIFKGEEAKLNRHA